MRFVSIRDLRSQTAGLRKSLSADREIVVTANGRPFAVMTPVQPDRVEEELLAIRQARARSAVSRLRAAAKSRGLDRLPPERVDALVAETRRGRRRAP